MFTLLIDEGKQPFSLYFSMQPTLICQKVLNTFFQTAPAAATHSKEDTLQYVRNERAIKAGVIFQTASSSWQITTRKRDKKEENPICETAACQSIENEIMCHFPEKAGIVLDSGGWKKMESENAHYFKYFI